MEAAGLNTGRTRTVTLLVNQENTFKVSAAEHIAQALSDFDLQIQVEALPWEEYAAALAAGNFDLYYGEVRLPANWDLSALVGTGGSLNYGGWADPQTEQLLPPAPQRRTGPQLCRTCVPIFSSKRLFCPCALSPPPSCTRPGPYPA